MISNDAKPIVIADNTEVIRILTDKGILHMLEIRDGEYDNEKYYHFAEDDYWCQAVHFVGHAEEKDNGYMIIKFLKSKLSKEQAASFFLEMMIANRVPGEKTSVTFKDIKPLACN